MNDYRYPIGQFEPGMVIEQKTLSDKIRFFQLQSVESILKQL